ncbi:MAG: hypothetical protein HQL07_07850 [Nitrospirae bacterium]|nr:hypothetical protein [Magnetococcales bacterium]HAT50513.1 hypothetical protein [Alphaproteobacteria bacterium]
MEAIALRYQVMVLQRSGKRPEFGPFDQLLWMVLSHLWFNWESCLEIIQQETAKRRNRLGWRVLV